ncbi:MAG: hypothetical protein ACR2NT_11820 [Acidimicrobiia bacterium]|nr:hypothetical protein [Acidimicrobiia bacterium]
MIVGHDLGFVFVKTSKTAGTSLEIGLSKFLGPGDVISTMRPEDEEIRRSLGYRGPQNNMAPFWEYRPADVARLVTRGERRERFGSHTSAHEARRVLGKEKWENYFTFCFERNPFERVISQYYWWQGKGKGTASLEQFITRGSGLESLKGRGSGLYMEDGKMIVDQVYRYEDLEEALVDIAGRLKLPEPLTLPRSKSGTRTDRRPYQEVLTPAQQDRIRSVFAEELVMFGYA